MFALAYGAAKKIKNRSKKDAPPSNEPSASHSSHSSSSAPVVVQPHGKLESHDNSSTGEQTQQLLSNTGDTQASADPDEPTPKQLEKARKRAQTNLDEVPIDDNPALHRYVIRRPRPLQVLYRGRTIETGDVGFHEKTMEDFELSHQSSEARALSKTESDSDNKEERSTDNVEVQRERLNLFIDLLWVGIISNISEHFFTQAFDDNVDNGRAVGEFIILFLPAWGLWSDLQAFLNSYYLDDLVQRLLVIWILICGLVWGNNAPFLLSDDGHITWAISSYLVGISSLRLTELVYSIWLPYLRRIHFWRFICTMPVTAFWIAAIFTSGHIQLAMVSAGIFFARIWNVVEQSPLGDRMWGDEKHLRRSHNYKHTIARFESFFIITVGEGVFLLVRGSPLGEGFGTQLGRGVVALMIYYLIHWTYFYGDLSKTIVHPCFRRWYLKSLWSFMHIPLSMAVVLLSSANLYLIDYTPEAETNGAPEGGIQKRAEACSGTPPGAVTKREDTVCTNYYTLRVATITAFVSLAVIFFCQLVLALITKPLDGQGTLRVNNRYVRLAPRAAAMIVFATVWIHDFKDPQVIIGCMATVSWIVFLWEWNAGMEKGGGFLEPKRRGVSRQTSRENEESPA